MVLLGCGLGEAWSYWGVALSEGHGLVGGSVSPSVCSYLYVLCMPMCFYVHPCSLLICLYEYSSAYLYHHYISVSLCICVSGSVSMSEFPSVKVSLCLHL